MNNLANKYMKRCFELAEKGAYQTAPNPRVGCVIVHKNAIIGEGYHEFYGGPHAEVNAIQSVRNQALLQESTLYVNLEPCAHYGKTPPCSDLILSHQIPHVVIANQDPFKHVNGRGIDRLRKAGVQVELRCLEEEGRKLNKRFFTFHEKKRPYLILKWAQTSNALLSRHGDDPEIADNWITSPASKQLVHLWRAEESAILVGKNTVLVDNPQLNCREVDGTSPLRVVIDQKLEISSKANIFNRDANTLIFNAMRTAQSENLEWVKIDFSNNILPQILTELHRRDKMSLIIEGGAETLSQFISQNLWNEARIFTGKKSFADGISAPKLESKITFTKHLSGDRIDFYINPSV